MFNSKLKHVFLNLILNISKSEISTGLIGILVQLQDQATFVHCTAGQKHFTQLNIGLKQWFSNQGSPNFKVAKLCQVEQDALFARLKLNKALICNDKITNEATSQKQRVAGFKKIDFKGRRIRKFENPWSKVIHKSFIGITQVLTKTRRKESRTLLKV